MPADSIEQPGRHSTGLRVYGSDTAGQYGRFALAPTVRTGHMSTFTGHHQLPIRYDAAQMSRFRRGKWVALICALMMIALSITSILVRHFS